MIVEDTLFIGGKWVTLAGPDTIEVVEPATTLQRVWELSAPAAGRPPIGDLDLPFERQDALAATIYGGTSEIQRNIITERLLGLPKE